MNTAPAFVAPTYHLAHIVNEHGVLAEFSRNGLCPYHPDIQLRKKKWNGVWTTVRRSCPRCDLLATQIPSLLSSSQIAAILLTMKNNERNADIQIKGCSELCDLAYNNDKNQVMIAEANGITTILSVMKTRSSNASTVQYNGCGALLRLAYLNDNNKVAIAGAGGIVIIAISMYEMELY